MERRTRQCCVCGCEYTPRQRNQVTCGDEDCKRIQHLEYMSAYQKRNRAKRSAYNRVWMAKRRGELKRIETEKTERESRMGKDYAEMQKAKTLAMAGKIEVVL